MYRCGRFVLVLLFLFLASSCQLSAASPIGVAVARGTFLIDGSPVSGNATLFEGSMLETGSFTSELQIHGGQRLLIAAESRGKVYRDRLVLEKGASELAGVSGFRVDAGTLRIAPEAARSAARVVLVAGQGVQVVSIRGNFRVNTADGRAVALLEPGSALEFRPQAAEEPEFTMTGCLERRQGGYVVRDLVAGVIEEVRGERLDRYVGSVVEVTASEMPNVKPVTGAEEVIRILRIRRVSGGCPAPPVAVKPAAPAGQTAPPAVATPPAATKKTGMSGAAKAVIAGVVIGGAGAGAVVVLTQKKNEGTISR